GWRGRWGGWCGRARVGRWSGISLPSAADAAGVARDDQIVCCGHPAPRTKRYALARAPTPTSPVQQPSIDQAATRTGSAPIAEDGSRAGGTAVMALGRATGAGLSRGEGNGVVGRVSGVGEGP